MKNESFSEPKNLIKKEIRKNFIGKEGGNSVKEKNRISEHAELEIEDLEYAIKMLRIKMQETTKLSEKIRCYNQIKTLQENIYKIKEEAMKESRSDSSVKTGNPR